jgi:hypothetical protein
MKNWDLATLAAVRTLRSRVTVAIYDLEASTIPEGAYMHKLRAMAVKNLQSVAAAYDVALDPDDIKFWEEPMARPEPETGETVQYKNVCARWFPVTVSVELMGGPADGDRFCLPQGDIGRFPFYIPEPPVDPIWAAPDAAQQLFPTATMGKCEYILGGWNPRKRIWIYLYQGTK